MAVWSTIFVEVWKRREHEIAHIWRMGNFENQIQQDDRADFKAELVIDHRLRKPKKMNITNPYLRRITDELPAVLLGIGAVIGCFIGYRYYRRQFRDPANSVGSSLVNAGIIVILGTVYQYVAKFLATWENHRFNSDWESSLATKNYSFQFVNAYIALFYIAFAE
jgi:anoctamin-10